MRFMMLLAAFLVCMVIAGRAAAVPTEITVRVKTKDAKFLGTSMKGAQITITDTAAGKVLAEGVTTGSTGDLDRIMNPKRGVSLSTPDSAKFSATIDISVPTKVEIKASGPLSVPKTANSVSVTQWVIPGKHLTGGDGVLLELPGFAVDVTAPAEGSRVVLRNGKTGVGIKAHIVMM
jgi:hypothetical protein